MVIIQNMQLRVKYYIKQLVYKQENIRPKDKINSQNIFHGFRFDEHSNRVELC